MSPVRQSSANRLHGIALVCLAFAIFSSVDANAKWLATAGYLPIQIAFMRYAGQFCIGLTTSRADIERFFRLNKKTMLLVSIRGSMLALATAFNFIALSHLPLTTTAVIMFSSPLWVCALSGPILGEKVGLWRWSAVLTGLIGVAIAAQPGTQFHWAMLASMSAALAFAIYSILSRQLASKVESTILQTSTGLIGTLALAPFLVTSWVWPQAKTDWLLFLLLGVCAWAGHELYIRAHARVEASTLSPFGYLLFVFMGLWGFALFGHVPDTPTIIGAALAVSAGVLIWWRELRIK